MQCECKVNSWPHAANASVALWNFLEFLSSRIFHLQLVGSVDVEPADIEGHLYLRTVQKYTAVKHIHRNQKNWRNLSRYY